MRLAVLVVLVLGGALALAVAASPKEGARARLTTEVPLGAATGTSVRVAWTVTVPDGNGPRRPFNAIGMFVRLLSRTGADPTTGVATPTAHEDGRYDARVVVPAGGIGGIRAGLRGSTEIFFPVENDPFISPQGVRCDVQAVRSTLAAFVRAYNHGQLRRLDRLFSREHFGWYSSPAPGVRLRSEAMNRATLMRYFAQRYRSGDRLEVALHSYNGYPPGDDLGHFALKGRRRADGFLNGDWFEIDGKGKIDCSKRPVTIAVLSLG
ncbi:MAG TPA: hypothetical protein VGQ84_07235 [Gaiellaceae bacterium]|nr:hypothetical protein [Gaiellaceae bacterium]